MTIGERIKARRTELGMTQDELARKLGYASRSSINKLELSGRSLKQSKIRQIAEALQTTPAYIMGWQSVSDADVEYVGALLSKDPKRTAEILELVQDLTDAQYDALVGLLKVMNEKGQP